MAAAAVYLLHSTTPAGPLQQLWFCTQIGQLGVCAWMESEPVCLIMVKEHEVPPRPRPLSLPAATVAAPKQQQPLPGTSHGGASSEASRISGGADPT